MSAAFRFPFFVIASFSFGLALTTGCSKNELRQAPVVSNLETQAVASAPAAAYRLADIKTRANLLAGEGPVLNAISTPSANPMIVATVTFQKASLLNRVFLYGSDLQYSSILDEGNSLILQSTSTGHTAVTFRIVDERLQMVADQRTQFESDINHPERLIHEFTIKAQDANSVTVEFTSASPVLNTVINGAKAPSPRTSWLRSAEFIPQGEYMNFETSIETPDGSIAEFMETFFPRDNLIPPDAKPLYATEDVEPLAKRYRFLDQGEIWLDVEGKGRTKVKVASRFGRTPGKTIDWYSTPNLPAEFVPQVKAAVEGWNRYSQKMFSEDLVAYKGALPAGVKIGDPRFNVINWDSVAEAGAAYESQATDPLTGLQSHSLIYLPKAWVNIGKQYWEQGIASEAMAANTARLKTVIGRASVLGHALPVNCLRDAMESISLEARSNPEAFARELLKGTLFHEMGHAMGLAHNFKGSLSLDLKDPKSAFSTSIMDYNQYQLEKVAFDSVESSTGPLLEYDRQILSVLYNQGKDVSSTDATLPACADEESDSEDEGVDPLCIRYDAGHDPSEEMQAVVNLTKNEAATIRDQRSLPTAIKALASELGSGVQLKTKEEVAAQLAKATKSLLGILNYYYASGAQSVSYMARANVRLLRTFKDETLPEGYDEAAMRARASDGIRYAAGLQHFEPSTLSAIEVYKQAVTTWLKTTTYVSGLAMDKQTDEVAALIKNLSDAAPAKLELAVLSGLRTRLFGDMKASEKAPFYFLENGAASVDFEKESALTLERAVTERLVTGVARPVAERVAAAKALKTFASTAVGGSLVTDAGGLLQAEAKSARTLEDRKNAVAVFKALTVDDPPAAK